MRVLPILVRQWETEALDPEVAELGGRMRLAVWQQNRHGLDVAASILKTMDAAGVQCLLLKGMAILLRHYPDSGLRGMGDIDFLVHAADVHRAAEVLLDAGWIADDHLPADQIVRQMRVRHAWQFSRAGDENCDLHWHPLVRCYVPAVADRFWEAAEPIAVGGQHALVPCAADQMFHVCAHGVQWNWTSQSRWVPDAMTILGSSTPIEWKRIIELAAAADMTVRMHAALGYLRARMEAPIPDEAINALTAQPTAAWEQREHALLQKPCPLGPLDSLRWHTAHFRRIQRFDAVWSKRSPWLAFVDYLRVFLRVQSARALVAALWRHLKSRLANRSSVLRN